MAYTIKAITSHIMQIRGRCFHVNQPVRQSHHEPETFHLSTLSSSHSGNATLRALRHLWQLSSHDMSKGKERRITILGYFFETRSIHMVFSWHLILWTITWPYQTRHPARERISMSFCWGRRVTHEHKPVSAAPRE